MKAYLVNPPPLSMAETCDCLEDCGAELRLFQHREDIASWVDALSTEDRIALMDTLCRGAYYDTAYVVSEACTSHPAFIKVAVHYGFTDLIATYVWRNGQIVVPAWTPPHRFAQSAAASAWLGLIKGDGDLDDKAWSAIQASRLVSSRQSVVDLLKGAYQSGMVTATDLVSGEFKHACLYVAVWTRRHDAVEYLVSRGYDLTETASGWSLWSSLHFANDLRTATLLLDAGVDPNTRGVRRQTPLHTVTDVAVTRLLLERGAVADAADSGGMTPLHCAKNALIAKLLVKGGASVHVSDTRGDTPLHVVKSVEVAKCLIELKADPSIKNNEGFTPLRRVRLDKKLDVVAYLRKVGAPA
jgi:hypothetical protein